MQTAEERALSLLDRFAAGTGLTSDADPRRYLWTDAFAVCTWLGLGKDERALALVDQVHHTLGRHRPDDPRDGWISGLPEEEAETRPTAGGLRIGKPLAERGPDDPPDRRREWDRDGQYFHYLTKWTRALDRVAGRTGERRYHDWAVELAVVSFDPFSHGPTGVPDRLYWKMSIDLSRPLVANMGQHDALDGYVALSTLRDGVVGANRDPDPDAAPALDQAIGRLARMTTASDLGTNDPLGVGALLTDAWLLARVTGPDRPYRKQILERVLEAGERSLATVRRSRLLDLPASRRLAFRELGLALGLDAVARLAGGTGGTGGTGGVDALPAVARRAESLADAVHMRSAIHEFWLDPEHQGAPTWTEHEDINTVMLATSLAPDGYLGPWPPE